MRATPGISITENYNTELLDAITFDSGCCFWKNDGNRKYAFYGTLLSEKHGVVGC